MERTRSIGPTYFPHMLGKNWITYYDSSSNTWKTEPYRDAVVKTYRQSVCLDSTHPGPPYQSGGPFYVRHTENILQPAYLQDVMSDQYLTDRWYTGGVVPAVGDGTALPELYTGSEYGAEAWNKAKPGKPGVDLAQALAELKDLPRLVTGLRDQFREAAGNLPRAIRKGSQGHLAYQFGLAPLVSDLRNLHYTYKNQETILDQIRRDNGKGIRRRRKLVSIRRSTSTPRTDIRAVEPLIWIENPTAVRLEEYSKEVWFAGRFRYYIPDIGSVEWRRRALTNLYGLRPNIRLLWELTPWSWLVDYFVDVGNELGNLQDDLAENLYADYAFMMAHQKVTITNRLTATCFSRSNSRPMAFSCAKQYLRETKSRIVASPFGFGLNTDGLSSRQQSIIAALAGSRIRA